MTPPTIAPSIARPPTTPPTIAPVFVPFFWSPIAAGTDVGVVTTVLVTTTPLSVRTSTLVKRLVSAGVSLLLGAAVVVLSVVEDAGAG
jgi:hypothetical protein